MTPLEIVGIAALGWAGGYLIAAVFRRQKISLEMISLEVAQRQVRLAVYDAFQAGMLAAADMVTHGGHEEVAGDIRRAVEGIKAANDN